MITTRLHNGELHCPVVICDACGEPVFGHGNTYWTLPIGSTCGTGIWHTHKGDCANYDEIIRSRTGELALWVPLDVWLKQLTYNTTVDSSVVDGWTKDFASNEIQVR